MKIALVIRALYRGVQLAKVETWKKAGVATAAMTGFLSAAIGLAVAFGWLSEVDPQMIMEVSSVLVTLVSLVLGYLQIATTEKIGMPDHSHQSEQLPGSAGQNVQGPAETQPRSDPRYSAHDDAFGDWNSDH